MIQERTIEQYTTEDLRATCMNRPRTQAAIEAAAELRRRLGENDWSRFVDEMHREQQGRERLFHVLCYLERNEYEQEYGKVDFEKRWYWPAIQVVRGVLHAEQRREWLEQQRAAAR